MSPWKPRMRRASTAAAISSAVGRACHPRRRHGRAECGHVEVGVDLAADRLAISRCPSTRSYARRSGRRGHGRPAYAATGQPATRHGPWPRPRCRRHSGWTASAPTCFRCGSRARRDHVHRPRARDTRCEIGTRRSPRPSRTTACVAVRRPHGVVAVDTSSTATIDHARVPPAPSTSTTVDPLRRTTSARSNFIIARRLRSSDFIIPRPVLVDSVRPIRISAQTQVTVSATTMSRSRSALDNTVPVNSGYADST